MLKLFAYILRNWNKVSTYYACDGNNNDIYKYLFFIHAFLVATDKIHTNKKKDELIGKMIKTMLVQGQNITHMTEEMRKAVHQLPKKAWQEVSTV